ncbi:hypothetical protein CCACVL1_28843 [Corchorus capsularis]|uniref:Myb/SANT-like domain-containing protein n=1 Tax=Corchorus capsularis TaxID=210143 RepID=A0A1R3G4Z6_COCAP|nr:hypothetical protein CCACVL1_28843 [Corchorus capsularis]
MGGRGKEVEDVIDWSKVNEDAFIQLLIGKVREGKLQSSTFKKEVWSEINDELREVIGEDYGIDRLKGKFNRLRTRHRQFSELIGHTGVKWDVTTNVVNASMNVWDHFFKISKEFRRFKKQGCAEYELLGEIFNRTTATGKLQQLSTEDPLTDTQERRLEEEFLSGSMHVDLDTENSEVEGDQRGKKRGSDSSGHRNVKCSKTDKMDAFLDKWAATLTTREEAYKAKADSYKSSSSSGSVDPHSTGLSSPFSSPLERSQIPKMVYKMGVGCYEPQKVKAGCCKVELMWGRNKGEALRIAVAIWDAKIEDF